MTKRDVVRTCLEGKTPPYVPWSFGFTVEAEEKLQELMTAVHRHEMGG